MTDENEPKKQVNESASTTEDDEIIELVDEVKSTPENEEEVIELTDVVADAAPTGAEIDEATDSTPDTEAVAADEASDEAISVPEPAEPLMDSDITIGDDFDDELDFDHDSQDDFLNSMGMDLEEDSDMSEITEEAESLPESETDESGEPRNDYISSEQVEAAIERVIMKILPEKFESILAEVIEKTLIKEIDKLKGILLQDPTQDDE